MTKIDFGASSDESLSVVPTNESPSEEGVSFIAYIMGGLCLVAGAILVAAFYLLANPLVLLFVIIQWCIIS